MLLLECQCCYFDITTCMELHVLKIKAPRFCKNSIRSAITKIRKLLMPVYFSIFCKNANTCKSARNRKRVKKIICENPPLERINKCSSQSFSALYYTVKYGTSTSTNKNSNVYASCVVQ